MIDICMVISTMPNRAEAEKLAAILLNKKLAACVQIDEIQSLYMWQDELCHANEARLVIKTLRSLYGDLKDYILEHHPYSVPQIIRIDIAESALGYSEWIQSILS
jgi:periplasmic divalent cation tolerance protein